MTWVKFDDQAPEHPKLIGLTDPAIATWWRGICWSSRHLTDGLLPPGVIPIIARTARPKKIVDELVDAGLWHPNGAGHHIHDYAKYQPTKAQVEAEREAWRKRQQKARVTGGVTP